MLRAIGLPMARKRIPGPPGRPSGDRETPNQEADAGGEAQEPPAQAPAERTTYLRWQDGRLTEDEPPEMR